MGRRPTQQGKAKTIDAPVATPEQTKPDPKKGHAEPVIETAMIEIPMGDVGKKEYLSRHVEARFTSERQRLQFKRVLRGLQQSGAKTANGRPVNRPGDALRWLFENI